MTSLLALLKEQGHMLGMPHCKILKGVKLRELRTIYGNQYLRLFFFLIGHNAYMLNGFTKDTDDTPSEVINKAIELKECINKGVR